MATQKTPAKEAPVSVVVPAGSSTADIFSALGAAAAKAASVKRATAPGSLKTPVEIGPGVVAQMQGTMLILAIETGAAARENAELTDKGARILAKAGPGFGRTVPLPGTDMGLSLYLGVPAPKGAK